MICHFIEQYWTTLSQDQISANNKLAQVKNLPFHGQSVIFPTNYRNRPFPTSHWPYPRLMHSLFSTNVFSLSCHHCPSDQQITVQHMFSRPQLAPLWLQHSIPSSHLHALSKSLTSIPNLSAYLKSSDFLRWGKKTKFSGFTVFTRNQYSLTSCLHKLQKLHQVFTLHWKIRRSILLEPLFSPI